MSKNILPEKVSMKLLISEKDIKKATKKLARKIAETTKDQPVVIIGILNAAGKFLFDLVNEFPNKTERFRYDFIVAKSFKGTKSQGWVTVNSLISSKLTDRIVVVVDCIAESGRTFEAVCTELKKYKPQRIITCALVKRKECPFPLDFYGFTVPKGKFLIGSGLDISDAYRWLPDIYELKE